MFSRITATIQNYWRRVLSGSGDSIHLCLLSDYKGNGFNILPYSIFTVGFCRCLIKV